MLTMGFYKSIEGFNEGDQGQSIIVDFMWGVDGINKTGVDRFNASQIGTAIWDDDFDMSSVKAQEEVFQLFETLKVQRELLYSEESVFCWITNFKGWLY
jgi:hypothetical protein